MLPAYKSLLYRADNKVCTKIEIIHLKTYMYRYHKLDIFKDIPVVVSHLKTFTEKIQRKKKRLKTTVKNV